MPALYTDMLRLAVVVCPLLALLVSPAAAAPVTFAYSGTVVSVGALDPANPFPTEPMFGTPFSGTYTFDSTAIDLAGGDTATGVYESSGGPFALTLDLGGLSFAYAAVSISVTDGYSTFGFGSDQYLAGFAGGPTVLSLRFTDFLDTLFAGDGLPQTPPPLAGLFSELFFTDIVAGNQVDLNGQITSLTCTAGCAAVPEPAAVMLAGTALAAFGARRWRRSPRC